MRKFSRLLGSLDADVALLQFRDRAGNVAFAHEDFSQVIVRVSRAACRGAVLLKLRKINAGSSEKARRSHDMLVMALGID